MHAKLIIGSLLFMVAGFIFLMLGRGSEPNVFQFLSIGASLIAGTLLVMGYLKERKRRTAPESGSSPAEAAVAAGSRPPDEVEADLKALEEGSDEEELQPAGAIGGEPLVSSQGAKKTSARNRRGERQASVPPEPVFAGAGAASLPRQETAGTHSGGAPISPSPFAMTPSSGEGSASPPESGQPKGNEEVSVSGPGGASQEQSETGTAGGDQLVSANRQWASLTSDMDTQKFEPPPLEKSKGKTKQQTRPEEGRRKGSEDMRQPVASAPNEAQTTQPDKGRRGLFGLFKRKATPAPAGPGSERPDETGRLPGAEGAAGRGSETDPAQVSPEGVAAELSAAEAETATEVKEEPAGMGSSAGRPESAPVGDAMEAVAGSVGGGPQRGRAKSGVKKKTAAKPKTPAKPKTAGKPKTTGSPKTAAKPKPAGRPKSPAKTKAATAKPKTGSAAKSAAKPKTSGPRAGAKASAKPKAGARKTQGPAGGM